MFILNIYDFFYYTIYVCLIFEIMESQLRVKGEGFSIVIDFGKDNINQ